jgi:hypothetical protein
MSTGSDKTYGGSQESAEPHPASKNTRRSSRGLQCLSGDRWSGETPGFAFDGKSEGRAEGKNALRQRLLGK